MPSPQKNVWVFSLVLTVPAIAPGGDLLPPPGPIMPTQRFLLNPQSPSAPAASCGNGLFCITQPGSYVLTGNITPTEVGGFPGAISINLNDPEDGGVTIDLNGFDVRGTSGKPGIAIQNFMPYVHIHNGSFREWNMGINLNNAKAALVENVASFGNFSDGILLWSAGTATLRNCQFNDNLTGSGVNGDGKAMLDNCTASGNGVYGFRVGPGSVLTNCTARDNLGILAAFKTGAGSILRSCTAYANASSFGFDVGNGTVLSECISDGNTRGGINVEVGADGTGVLVDRCIISGINAANLQGVLSLGKVTVRDSVFKDTLGGGVRGGDNSSVINSTFDNTGAEPAVRLEDFGVVRGCTIEAFGDVGIQLEDHSEVADNTIKNTGTNGSGIKVSDNCRVFGNLVRGNAAAIEITGSGNRIQNNQVFDSGKGIFIDTTGGNLVIGNSARNNTTHYDIAAGNTVGPTVTSADIATSSNPHANYEH